jgi:hypothetical protein
VRSAQQKQLDCTILCDDTGDELIWDSDPSAVAIVNATTNDTTTTTSVARTFFFFFFFFKLALQSEQRLKKRHKMQCDMRKPS